MYVPSSVLIRGGYGLFGENLEEDLYFKIEAGETGDIEFRISKLNQNVEYVAFISAGNDLPHFKKDLLNDKQI